MPIKAEPGYNDNATYLKMAASGDESAIAHLMEQNMGLVRSIVRRFNGRGVDTEDLMQIGSIGMLKAIRSFDIERGTAFSTYAVPLIFGEIRRFLRDDGQIKVGRKQKKTGAALLNAREKYVLLHGQEPQLSELAAELNITTSEAALALDAVSPLHSLSESLSGDDDDFLLENVLEAENPIEKRIDSIALCEIIGSLPPLWRRIVVLRYYRELSQQATAQILGLSQVKVSREEKKLFEYLKHELTK